MNISQTTPYKSFNSWKKYFYKESPMPVSQRVVIGSEDLELYSGNNAQVKSIQRNRIVPLNHFDVKPEQLKVGLDILNVLLGQKSAQQNSQAQQQQMELQRRQAEETRKTWQQIGIGFAILVVVGVIAIAVKSK